MDNFPSIHRTDDPGGAPRVAATRLGAVNTPDPTRGATSILAYSSRAERRARARRARVRRHEIARALAEPYDGVLTRRMLLAAGVTPEQIRAEVEAGAWHKAGWHTLAVSSMTPQGRGLWWRALWESRSGAVLDGVTSLLASGLTGWNDPVIHVSVPHGPRLRPIEGVVHHHPRVIGPTLGGGLARTASEVATIRAATWAVSDRQAATLVAMAVQQRLVAPAVLLERWRGVGRHSRRVLLDGVVADVCDGAHSLGELDFARLCRDHGLPAPERQAVRSGVHGRVYLDAWWDTRGVHVEIQGAQHYAGLTPVDDALRANDLRLRRVLTSIEVPVLGLRLCPEKFMAQVAHALELGRRGAA